MDAANSRGLSVSAKPNKNFLYIGELLKKYELERLFPQNELTANDVVTFKDLLERCVSISGTCSFLQQQIDYLKKTNSVASEETRSFLNSLITLRDCFQLVKTAINSKHLKRYAEEPLFFCALCWKRVRVSVETEHLGRRDSTFYCPDHLPKRSEHLYRKDKTALISAMKTTDSRFLEELHYYEKLSFKTSFSLAPTFYKWLGSFSPKPSAIFSSIQSIDNQSQNWQSIANRITELSLKIYPNAYEKINQVDSHQYSSIDSWLIDGIVSALDKSRDKNEVNFWNHEEANRIKLSSFLMAPNTPIQNSFENEHLNEYLMLTCGILSRYEAYQIVKMTPQPRGGGNIKDETLRSKIKSLRDHNIATTGKPNVESIAEEMNLSPARVYAILKE
ncbi:hypothetical protein ISG33_12930 [Glaciecola sp. MH2013]|uniref:hypothetical protein n=1 Tax=Glaciecola sp. MH2013 TaxID=2785524 RepID=UPI00189CC646|nr:hypothetical protein [Glaciecola sp. MH2013]MBF7074304.1 hypothetical protein [Glaciecola sp. MH2013]